MKEMTQPTVVPEVEPETKPRPDTKPAPKPREDDPWTVPKPKRNPTPKAKKMKRKKVVIENKAEFDAFRALMTVDTFFKKYTLSMNLVKQLGAEAAMFEVQFTDREMTPGEKRLLLKSGEL